MTKMTGMVYNFVWKVEQKKIIGYSPFATLSNFIYVGRLGEKKLEKLIVVGNVKGRRETISNKMDFVS